MKSKNTLVVIGTIAFIVAYQFLVLGPYTEKKRAYEEAQSQASSKVDSSSDLDLSHSNLDANGASTAPQDSTASETSADNIKDKSVNVSTSARDDSGKILPLKNPSKITDFNVGGTRNIEVFEGGTLGAAKLADFFDREAAKLGGKKPIQLNKRGLYWYASNPDVQRCINEFNVNSLVKGNPNDLVFKVQTNKGSCQLLLQPEGKHDGLLKIALILDGFDSSAQDVLELRGQMVLGSTKTLDQNFLSYKLDDSVEKIHDKKVFEQKTLRGKLSWVTWGDRYFSLIFKPQGAYNPDLVYGLPSTPENIDLVTATTPMALRYPLQPERGKSSFEYDLNFYFGARSTTVLNDIDAELVETVELGFFASVARVMLWALQALNQLFQNYGVSIIALTLIVRAIFWPLNKKAYKSQAQMKEIQPEMDRIRKKYDSKDRAQAEQMNREIFALYKARGVNPLGGCLPLLLQMPILIGLYGGLNNSIELYQAPFVLWIQDLSLPDSYFVLPIIWTVSLLGYMKINPQTMNTSQPGMPNMKWMFIGMNLFFGYLSKDWPSGLVLYLVVSNGVGLTQQYFIQRGNKKIEIVKEGA